MTHYRFPLLLAIATVYWNVVIPGDKVSLGVNHNVLGAQETIIAQSDDSSLKGDNYDLQMKKGYDATQEKDYETALAAFEEALKARPNDQYAQQAVQNIQAYLDRAKLFWVLVLLGILALVGIGASLLLFFLLQKRRSLVHQIEASDDDKTVESPSVEAQTETWQENELIENNHISNHLDDGADLASALENSPIQEAAIGLEHISRMPSSDELQTLVSYLDKDLDPKIRRKAIWDLAQKSDSRAMKPLVELMIEVDSQERSLILEALSQISTRTLKPMNKALAVSLQDNNPQVRKNAIRDLTRIYDLMSQISQMLCHAIDDGDSEVKETAKWALNQINLQMPPRLDLLSSPETPEVSVEQSYSESTEI